MGNKLSHPKLTRRSQDRSNLNYASSPAFPPLPPPPYTTFLDSADEITLKHRTIYETHFNTPPSERQENVMKMLANYNTVFLVDDSLSMGNLWDQVSCF